MELLGNFSYGRRIILAFLFILTGLHYVLLEMLFGHKDSSDKIKIHEDSGLGMAMYNDFWANLFLFVNAVLCLSVASETRD